MSNTGFGVPLSQDLGCHCPSWGAEFLLGGCFPCSSHCSIPLPTLVRIQPLALLLLLLEGNPPWGFPASTHHSCGLQAKAPSRDKPLSLLSAAGCRNLAGGSEPAVPRPPPLALPSLPRKMETGDKGTFLRCIQPCPLPEEHQEVV